MTCPKCKSPRVATIDTRSKPFGTQRRRQCTDCGQRFSTAEISTEEYKKFKELHRLIEKEIRTIDDLNRMISI